MSDRITLNDILAARLLVWNTQPQAPEYILSSKEALRWCHLSDHRLACCVVCRGDEEGMRRLVEWEE